MHPTSHGSGPLPTPGGADEARQPPAPARGAAGVVHALFLVDAGGRTTFVNPDAERLLGRPAADLCGRPLLDLIHAPLPEGCGRHGPGCPLVRALATGTRLANHEEVLVGRGGAPVPVLCWFEPIVRDGVVTGGALIGHDPGEWNRAERATRLLANIVESTDDAIVSKDLNGIVTSWNRSAERIFGYTAAEMVGRPIAILAPPDDAEDMPRVLDRIRRGERVEHYETRRRTRDGRIIHVSLTVSPLHDAAGRVVGASKVARDITERRRAEAELARSLQSERAAHRRVREVLASITDSYIVVDRRWRVVEMNRQAEVVFGRSADDLVGKVVWEEYPGAVDTEFYRQYQRAMAEGVAVHFEAESAVTDKWFEAHAYPSPEGLSIYLRDITARKRTGEELERERALLDLFLESAPVGFGFWDRDFRYVRLNDALAAIKGIPRDAHLGRTVAEMLPELWPVVEPYHRAAAAGRATRDIDVSGTTPASPGATRHWLTRYYPVRTPAGEFLGVGAVVNDITERRRAEDALRESEERFHQLADNIPHGFIYQIVQSPGPDGPVGRFSYVSGGVVPIFGVTPADVTADPTVLYGRVVEEDAAAMRTEEEACLRDGRPFEYRFRTRGVGGEVRWLHCRSAPRPLPDGGSIWDGVALDITDQKRAEERQAFLAEAGRVLGSSLDYEATLADVCRLAVPVLADWCALDLVADDGTIRRLAVAHVDPARVELAQDLRRRYPPHPDDGAGVARVIRSGEAELHEVTDEALARGARDAEHLAILRALGLRSVLLVPLVVRGRVLGAMTLATAESSRRFNADDRELARELGARAALAVDNARLFAERQEAALRREEALVLHRGIEEKLTLLVQASGSLSESLELPSVLTAILDLSRRLVAADAYAVWRHEPSSGHWGIAVASGLSEEYRRATIRVLEGTTPLPATPIVAEDVLAAPQLGEREQAYRREGIRSLLAVPLRTRGRRDGTLAFYYRSPHAFSGVELPVATALANLAASAIGTAELYEELRANDRRKDEFLAMLAHELRSPLSAVSNAVNLAKRAGPGDEQAWSRDVIERQVKHFARLIEDLLDVSRITRGKIRLQTQTVELTPVLNHALESVRPLVEERKHRLTVSFAPEPLWLEADPVRLEQIAVNLLTNAAKYTDAGGRIWLTTGREADHVVISVRDDGVGIPPEKLPLMFELFAQGDRSIARSEGGLGIGLTLVKSLAEMHGGGVTALSGGPGRGSEFVVRLPAAVAPAAEPPAPQAPAGPLAERHHRILIVDDSVDTARGMARLLRLLGHDVRTVHDGNSAVEAARELRPDFVLLDIGLPGMDGYQVAAALRREECCRGSVIIAVSGYGQEDDRRRSREAGIDHHLVKPVDYDTLAGLIAGR